jgi:K+ transporter
MVEAAQPVRVPGTAVFMTAQPTGTLPALAHNLRYNKVLHKRVVLTVATAQVPRVPDEERLSRFSPSGTTCSTSVFSTGSWRPRTSPKRWS